GTDSTRCPAEVGPHLGRAALQLIAPGQTLSAPASGLLEHNRRRLPLALANLAANRPRDGVRVGILVLLQPGAAGNCRSMPLAVTRARAPDSAELVPHIRSP